MIKEIVKDEAFLAKVSEVATQADSQIAQDLLDTLKAHEHECVGLAANMIGELKRVIVFKDGKKPIVMYNPKIVKKNGEFKTKEGCISLEDPHDCVRYKRIEVEFEDINFKKLTKKFTGFTAQIIQHEIDHCDGIVI